MTDNIDTEMWIEDYLAQLIELTGLDVTIEEISLDDEDTLYVQLVGPDSARVIGREGQALDALQHIITASAIHNGARKQRILIDVEDYRKRRESRVCDEAVYMAEQALNTGEIQELSPMSPRERRLVHRAVTDIDGVMTKSLGQGDERFVQIVPVSE